MKMEGDWKQMKKQQRRLKRSLQRTFKIREEEIEEFNEEKEREVEEWILRNQNRRKIENIIDYERKQVITEELVKEIKSFKEKSPGPSGGRERFRANLSFFELLQIITNLTQVRIS